MKWRGGLDGGVVILALLWKWKLDSTVYLVTFYNIIFDYYIMATEKEELPKGWATKVWTEAEGGDGRIYYVDEVARTTQWEKPKKDAPGWAAVLAKRRREYDRKWRKSQAGTKAFGSQQGGRRRGSVRRTKKRKTRRRKKRKSPKRTKKRRRRRRKRTKKRRK